MLSNSQELIEQAEELVVGASAPVSLDLFVPTTQILFRKPLRSVVAADSIPPKPVNAGACHEAERCIHPRLAVWKPATTIPLAIFNIHELRITPYVHCIFSIKPE